ncbi:MAG: hypothetical protein HC927_01055 [Deltaproteobacteria bacterium]|nr:hypothetical protein [Deltaproteobacteria bacterium]
MLTAASLAGCKSKNRRRDRTPTLGDLNPPRDAPDWESRFNVAFDDSYTPTSLNLQGRAPNDVLDQQLFQARLGHAALVLLVRVEQVWGRGRYQGRQKQFVEVLVGETLLGSLPKDAPDRLLVEIDSIDELPGALKGEIMLLFVRWDSESEPPYHHHLMPADDDVVALIKAMVEHAKAEGVLDKQGEETGGKRGKGKRGKRGQNEGGKRKAGKKKKDKRGGGPVEPVDDSNPGGSSGTPILFESSGGDPGAGDGEYTPPSVQPDDSTGLQDLGGEPKPEEPASGDAPP